MAWKVLILGSVITILSFFGMLFIGPVVSDSIAARLVVVFCALAGVVLMFAGLFAGVLRTLLEPSNQMQMILRKEWKAIDAANPREVRYTRIPAGTHEVERIPNPMGHPGYWIVLKGTMTGASEGFWRQWAPGQTVEDPESWKFGQVIDWEEFTVVIME